MKTTTREKQEKQQEEKQEKQSNGIIKVKAYLGYQGYSIFKETISVEQQHAIRKELMVNAHIPKSPVQPAPFPVYRESLLKIYVPRYFGMERYGSSNIENKIAPGHKIALKFAGELRDYQNVIVDKYLKAATTTNANCGGGGLLDVDPGKGKTVMALKVIERLAVKTLVVVHKSFLTNQWKERIEQFLPGARVGTIQGQVFDIENKDIVIGMVQSLSMKEYPQNAFESFGLTVFDECHHMGAEVFSRCMMKLMTTYTLGLSGTMQRKDGLSKVFKMFLGDVVHKEKAESEHGVLVKGIKYVVDDDEFNEVEYDYRGNPKFSTMISKLCNYNRRSEFIVEVVIKELQHNPDQQIMILAHNKSLLQYLFKAIEYKKVATVGYYLGGMKEVDLKSSESKKIVIATYAMASEGLDIKTLTTLIMATPKTDVCQSVGRILRTKHTTPVVIDIIDAHDLFINQWQKRKAYYKKQNYKIIVTENGLYESDEKKGCWLTAYIPKLSKSISLINCDNNDDEDDDVTVTTNMSITNTNRKQPALNGTCFL
jgi:superfamily II DNA or RNA helicase